MYRSLSMRVLPNGDHADLPVVKPATAGKEYQDSLMKATYRTKAENERLAKILDYYINH